jgi:PAS domain S-box-containing protein
MEIISYGSLRARNGKTGCVTSMLERALSRGFDGLRLAFIALPELKSADTFIEREFADIRTSNVLAQFAYPRDEFDTLGVMEAAKRHRFALVRNAGRWEAIESSEARVLRGELERTEELYRSLFENMLNGFAYCRMLFDGDKPSDFVYLTVNDAFEKLTGLRNVVGRRVTEIIPGIRETDPGLFEIYGRVATSGVPEQFETYVDALKEWFSISVYSPKKDHFVTVFDVVTGRKRAEEALRESHERLKRVLEVETVGVMFWDLNSGCMYDANDAFLNLMGYSRSEVEARELTWQKLTPPEYMDASRAEVQKFLATGRVGPYEKEYLHKDGTRQWFVFAGSSLGNNTCVEFCVDISARKKVEAELLKRNQELDSLNKELDAFVYSVSHDLRAPLRTMEGFAKIISQDYVDKLDSTGKDFLDRIRGASARMSRLIEELLRLSRISRQEAERIEYDLSAIASDVMTRLREEDKERNVEVHIAEGQRAFVDPGLMKVALSNLLGNAWKFTSKTEKARIEFGAMNRDGKTIYFVRDNGAGFDQAYADKMFLPFQRLHTEKEFEGTGIGLAIAERIIRRHGGRIWAEGTVGKGATIYFTL